MRERKKGGKGAGILLVAEVAKGKELRCGNDVSYRSRQVDV